MDISYLFTSPTERGDSPAETKSKMSVSNMQSLFEHSSYKKRPPSSEDHHLIEADGACQGPRSTLSSKLSLAKLNVESLMASNSLMPTVKPIVHFKEVTSYSAKLSWHLEVCCNESLEPGRRGGNLDLTQAKYMLFVDIPGDSERFRPLYFGPKNRIKITGLRRSTIYRLFVRVYLDPRGVNGGSFSAFATLQEPKFLEDGPSNDKRHFKGLLAYANPKEKDNMVLSIPSFRAAMWCRRYCVIGDDPEQRRLDVSFAWQHYKWTSNENGWSEMRKEGFREVIKQNLVGVQFDELDQCNIELQEYSTEEDFHTVIKEAHKSAQCWRSKDCVPCSIGALHLCRSISLIYWLTCELCGADYIGYTPSLLNLSETLSGQHVWLRKHFTRNHPEVLNESDGSEDVERCCIQNVTGVVLENCTEEKTGSRRVGNEDLKQTCLKYIQQLRPTDNSTCI